MTSSSLAERVLELLTNLEDCLKPAMVASRALTPEEGVQVLLELHILREAALSRKLNSEYERVRRSNRPADSVMLPHPRIDG